QGLSLANTTIVPLFQDLLDPLEFSVQANASAVDVVGDVVGYFDATNVSDVAQGETTAELVLTDTCVKVAECVVTNPNTFARDALDIGTAAVNIDHQFTVSDLVTVSLTTSDVPVCISPLGSGAFSVRSLHDSQVFEGSIPVARIFPVLPGGQAIIRMYAIADVPSPQSVRKISSASVQCFLP